MVTEVIEIVVFRRCFCFFWHSFTHPWKNNLYLIFIIDLQVLLRQETADSPILLIILVAGLATQLIRPSHPRLKE